MIKGIIFDRDGTLIDNNKTWVRTMLKVIQNLSDTEEQRKKLIDFVQIDEDALIFHAHSPVLAQSPTDYLPTWAEILDEKYNEAFVDKIDDLEGKYALDYLTAFPDVKAVISRLYQQGFIIGLATNGSQKSAVEHLQALGLAPKFSFIAGYDSGYGQKPGPGQLLAFARQNELAPENIIMIGDTMHDIEAAKQADIASIAILLTPTTPAEEERQSTLKNNADYTAQTLSECLDIIMRLNANTS